MTFDDIYTHVEKNLKPKRMACILHDKDKKDDNITPVEPHIHMMLQFENARSVNSVAKEIGDNPQQLEIWKGNADNGFSYLIHATDSARTKHQYSCDEVRANFDYYTCIAKIASSVSKTREVSSARKMNTILDLVATGELKLVDAKNQLTGSEYARAGDKLKKAHELFLERKSLELQKQMEDNNELVHVNWFYGASETGKSFLAEKLAKESGLPYYKTTTTTDPFQFYQAEPIIILDELRPAMIPYSELLALFDPFSRGRVAVSSRYSNKALCCKTIYITTPYSPDKFYLGYRLNIEDGLEQITRRLASVMLFDMDYIYSMEYKQSFHTYRAVDKMENDCSKKHQGHYVLNNVFDSIKQRGTSHEV